MKERTWSEYIDALDKASEDPECRKVIEELIGAYIGLIAHMKDTPLWDIYEYERKLVEPMKIFAYENNKLKKEVNELRRKLGMIEKYKEI